jgi:death on curing protein
VPGQSSGAVEYLNAAEVEVMHEELMAGFGQQSILRDRGALESAVLRPQNAAYSDGADIWTQAASLIAGIAPAHAFEDGNKRLADLAGATFLLINDLRIAADPVAYADQLLALVNHGDERLEDAATQLAQWLRQNTMRQGEKPREDG